MTKQNANGKIKMEKSKHMCKLLMDHVNWKKTKNDEDRQRFSKRVQIQEFKNDYNN